MAEQMANAANVFTILWNTQCAIVVNILHRVERCVDLQVHVSCGVLHRNPSRFNTEFEYCCTS